MPKITLTDPTSQTLDLFPEMKYSDEYQLNKTILRARSGKRYEYIWEKPTKKYKIPISFVTSADKNILNTWYTNINSLSITFTDTYFVSGVATYTVESFSGVIVGNAAPIDRQHTTVNTLFFGTVKLEEI